uniref:Probable mitochondrial import receptor subunit TOM20 isoform X1 n=1 Tax=Nicotiana tabacum TaxID=4097 RepID=A0A1S3YZ02_TOBAC|nr:PREDICTED: probable mitochondrial import receptor subunit TOM20 isoform X1 [Nicotiana tabacum]
MDMSVEIDIELLFQTRLNADAKYSLNPNDTENLTQWGMALLQLAQYGTLQDSKKMVKGLLDGGLLDGDVMFKCQPWAHGCCTEPLIFDSEALRAASSFHDAWINTHKKTAQLTVFHLEEAISKLEEIAKIDSRKHEALWHLGKAHSAEAFLTSDSIEALNNFEKADRYFQKALDEDPRNEMYRKSMETNVQAMLLHMKLQLGTVQQASGGSSTSFNAKSSAMKANHDLVYDVFGWVLLGAGIVAWLGMEKSQAHLCTPR